MSVPASSSWRQIGLGVFQQPHDSLGMFFENMFKNDNELHRQSFMIVTHCRIHFSLDADEVEAKLRKAWKTMRYYNPGIACEWDGHHRTYKIPTDVELARWMRESFQVSRKSVEEILDTIRDQFQPVFYFLRGDESNRCGDILLASYHAFNEGRGNYTFLDSLFKAMNNPQDVVFGDEAQYLPPTRDELLGLPSFPSVKSWLKGAEIIRSAFAPSPRNILLPARQPPLSNAPEQRGSLVTVALSEDQTSELVAVCRKQGYSVTAAMKTAIMLAAHPLNSPHQDVYLDFDFYDTRPFMRKPLRAGCHTGEFCCAILPSQIELGDKTFNEIAREVHGNFERMRSEMKSDPSGIDAVPYIMNEVFGGTGVAPTTPFFSSIGVVENCMWSKYGDVVDIESTWVAVPANGMTNHNAWFPSSFRGKFQLTVTYSKAFYEKRVIDDMINKAFGVMFSETGIQNSSALSIKQFA